MGLCACHPCKQDTGLAVEQVRTPWDGDADDLMGSVGLESSSPSCGDLADGAKRCDSNLLLNGIDEEQADEPWTQDAEVKEVSDDENEYSTPLEGDAVPPMLRQTFTAMSADSKGGRKLSYRTSWVHVQSGLPENGGSVHHSIKDSVKLLAKLMTDGLNEHDMSVADVLREVEHLVDIEYDILLAEMLLEELKAKISVENWNQIVISKVCSRFKRKFRYLARVGRACTSHGHGWFNVYRDPAGGSYIDGFIDNVDNKTLYYRAKVMIPAKLTNVMAVANEVQLMPVWNALVQGEPKVVGRRTAHYLVLNYQMSFLGGMYKLDVLNEIRRFSDIKGGYLAEYIQSVEEGHPCYKQPLRGHKQPKQELKNVWVACGDSYSALIQVGKVTLPFAASQWLASSIGGIAGRFIVGGLVKNSTLSCTPGNRWEKLVQEDALDFYSRLDECVASPGSLSRAPAKPGEPPSFTESDLIPFFQRERIHSSMAYGGSAESIS